MKDTLLATDQGTVTIIVLLDYSAAFDTVDHSIAVDILQNKLGVSGSATTFLASHFQSHSTLRPGKTSTWTQAYLKVPPWGRFTYITYASELQVVAERHVVVFHSFADDTQLSKATRVEDIEASKQAIVN